MQMLFWHIRVWAECLHALSLQDLDTSVPMVDFCGWNPYADCTDFVFYDQNFLDRCKSGDPVSYELVISHALGVGCLHLCKTYTCTCIWCRTLKIFLGLFPCATQFYHKMKMVCCCHIYTWCHCMCMCYIHTCNYTSTHVQYTCRSWKSSRSIIVIRLHPFRLAIVLRLRRFCFTTKNLNA